MTEAMCDQVAERLALGEALGESTAELAEHAASCSSCQGLVAVSQRLGASRSAVDPGLGFSARMTVGAQHLLGVRRRRRIAAGLAATVATGMFGVFVVAHDPASPPQQRQALEMPRPTQDPVDDKLEPASDDDLAALVDLADTDRSMRLSAHWSRIKKPMNPYKKLLKGDEP
jgi:hypothetical protein